MRQAIIVLCVLCSCFKVLANPPRTIKAGVSFDTAKLNLQTHGYEVDTRKHGLAMVAPKGQGLEFCVIDKNVTIVIGYSESTREIAALQIVFTPDNPVNKLQRVSRDALEVSLEEGGIYTIKLQRADTPTATRK